MIKWRVETSCNFVMSKNSAKHQLVNETLELETETFEILVETRPSQIRPRRDRDDQNQVSRPRRRDVIPAIYNK